MPFVREDKAGDFSKKIVLWEDAMFQTAIFDGLNLNCGKRDRL